MKTVAIIQARMGSSRLPGKVLAEIAGRPMINHVYHRVAQAKKIGEVVVATTVEPVDDPLVDLCLNSGWRCFRGSQPDVLDRYYQAATASQADVVVRVTADCPLIDPQVIDEVVDRFQSKQPAVDYASNTHEPRTAPRGLDVEVFTFAALEKAWREATDPSHREHVTPYLYRSAELFKLLKVHGERDDSHHRWTVDTPEDLRLVRMVYEELGDRHAGWREVLQLIEERPEWSTINAHIKQKKVA